MCKVGVIAAWLFLFGTGQQFCRPASSKTFIFVVWSSCPSYFVSIFYCCPASPAWIKLNVPMRQQQRWLPQPAITATMKMRRKAVPLFVVVFAVGIFLPLAPPNRNQPLFLPKRLKNNLSFIKASHWLPTFSVIFGSRPNFVKHTGHWAIFFAGWASKPFSFNCLTHQTNLRAKNNCDAMRHGHRACCYGTKYIETHCEG